MLRLGVVKVSTPMMPKGTAVHSSHGRNLPQLVLVRSAITPMTGLKAAAMRPTTRKSVPACAGGEAEGVGVIAQLQGQHRLEDEVGGHVAQAVAELLCEGKFLDHRRRLVFWRGALTPLLRHLQGEFVQVGVARGGADHDFEVAGLDDVLHVDVVEGQRVRA